MKNITIGLMWIAISAAVIAGIVTMHDMKCLWAFALPTVVTLDLLEYHDATFEVGKKYAKRWLNKIGEEQFRRLLNVRRADIKAQADINQGTRLQKIDNIGYILEEVLQDDECFSLKDLAVNGKDLITIGYKSGKEIGEVLNDLLDSVISGENINEKEKLLEIAERRLHG